MNQPKPADANAAMPVKSDTVSAVPPKPDAATAAPAETTGAQAAQTATPEAPQQTPRATGPKYLKDVSSQNALKHGLSAKRILMPDESPEEFAAFNAGLIADLAPRGAMEEEIVRRIIACSWKLRRGDWLETATLQQLSECQARLSAAEKESAGPEGGDHASSPEQNLAGTVIRDFGSPKSVLATMQRYCTNISNEMAKAMDRLLSFREKRLRLELLEQKAMSEDEDNGAAQF